MCEISILTLFVSIFTLISLIDISATEYVPVYMWETTQFSEIVPALERVSQESFKKIISDRATKNTPILVFAEQNLSPEDFILHDEEGKSPFLHLEALKSSAQISYWPFVRNPIKVFSKLPDKRKVETSIKSIIDDPNFTLEDNDVLIVDLNDAGDGEDRIQMLKRHDKDVVAIYNRLFKEHKNLITLFTAYHPSWIITEELRSNRRIRETNKTAAQPAADEEEGASHQFTNDDVLMYITDMGNLSINGTITSLDAFKKVTTVDKTEVGMNITLERDTDAKIKITFNFAFAGGYWSIIGIVAHSDDKDFPLVIHDVYAPVGFSYHCTAQVFYQRDEKTVNLTLPGFQVQPFFENTETKRFGDAYDCVGFMSTPIWSGLFVTFILVLIMTFGLTMMMDIKTMDRFDDPKGKTITINATE